MSSKSPESSTPEEASTSPLLKPRKMPTSTSIADVMKQVNSRDSAETPSDPAIYAIQALVIVGVLLYGAHWNTERVKAEMHAEEVKREEDRKARNARFEEMDKKAELKVKEAVKKAREEYPSVAPDRKEVAPNLDNKPKHKKHNKAKKPFVQIPPMRNLNF